MYSFNLVPVNVLPQYAESADCFPPLYHQVFYFKNKLLIIHFILQTSSKKINHMEKRFGTIKEYLY